jgi:predicted RNase H-like nuclease (RuvC/YqgF family)
VAAQSAPAGQATCSHDETLAELRDKVQHLIGQCETLEQEKAQLEQQLQELVTRTAPRKLTAEEEAKLAAQSAEIERLKADLALTMERRLAEQAERAQLMEQQPHNLGTPGLPMRIA